MSGNYMEPSSVISDVTFLGKAGERIKFSFTSDIESGDLDIILYDPNGDAVYEMDRAKALETFFNLKSSGTYTFAAICSGFA